MGGVVAQSVERATPGEEVRFPLWPPAPYWLGRCQHNVIGWDRSHGLCTLFSPIVDEDVKKPNKQDKQTKISIKTLKINLSA